MNNENQYNYTYSAKDRAEIKQIREKYSPKEENKMEQLRRLDASVTRKGTIVSLVVGIISSLILGFGMSCCMGVGRYTLYGWYSCGHYRTYRGRHILPPLCLYHEKRTGTPCTRNSTLNG